MPEDAGHIIEKLNEHGYEAYIVGGCVRDALIGKEPDDWDITTSATPKQVKAVFPHTVDTGIEHGTVTVLMRDNERNIRGYEVTTFRIDGEYKDGRHPANVEFTPSLEEDLKRRDFTINAMAYNDETGIVDLFGGLADIENHVIRCVGDPDARFGEDALRLMRAVRFAAQLGFTIEPGTFAAVSRNAASLSKVSRERVYTELNKLICSARPDDIRMLLQVGLAPHIAEDFDRINTDVINTVMDSVRMNGSILSNDVYGELVRMFDGSGSKRDALSFCRKTALSCRYLRYAFVFSDLGAESASGILKALKSDNDTADRTHTLVAHIKDQIPLDRYGMKKLAGSMTAELFADLLVLKASLDCIWGKEQKKLEQAAEMYADIVRRREPVYLKDLEIKGTDLIRAGVKPGPELGRLLNRMLDDVRREPEHNSVEYLIEHYV